MFTNRTLATPVEERGANPVTSASNRGGAAASYFTYYGHRQRRQAAIESVAVDREGCQVAEVREIRRLPFEALAGWGADLPL